MASELKDQALKPSRKEAEYKKDDLQIVWVKGAGVGERHMMNQHWWEQEVESGRAVSGQGPQFLFLAGNVLDSLQVEPIVPNLVSYYLSSPSIQLKFHCMEKTRDTWPNLRGAWKGHGTDWLTAPTHSLSPVSALGPIKAPSLAAWWCLFSGTQSLRHRSSALSFLLRSHL